MHDHVTSIRRLAIRSILVVSLLGQSAAAGAPPVGHLPSEPDATAKPAGGSAAQHMEESAAGAARTLDDVVRDLSAKWKKINSLKAEIKMTARDKNAAQNLEYGGYGAYACLKTDGELLIRRDMVNTILPVGGERIRERKSTILTHENVTYFTGVDGDKTFANKMQTDADDIVRMGGQALFDQLHRLYTLELQPDTEIHGEAIHVIRGTPRKGTGRAAFLFSRTVGVMLQMTLESETGESSRTVSFSKIELNPRLEPSFFEFHPPPGVSVYDMTKLPGSPK